MTDIATLGLEIRSDGVVVASQRLQQMTKDGKAAEGATSKLSSATSALTGYLKAAAAAFGLYKLAEYAKDAALLAARYQTLGVVMNTVGATAGYTNAQMAGFEKTLQKQGIAMVESRQVLTQMAQAHLDLAKASELGRVAQDAATIGGINSSEAFERLVSGIQKGETEILKTIGITVNFEQAYVKLASQLGKSRDALSENEKTQARMNIVLERGKDIAGVYEAAMGTAGKQLTSMKRYTDNLKVAFGEAFGPLLITVIESATEQLKIIEKWFDDNPSKVKEWGLTLLSYLYQASAEFLRFGMLLDKIGGTLTSAQMLLSGPGAALGNEGATKRFEAAAKANIEFEDRYNQKDKMIEGLAVKMNDVEARIEQAQKGAASTNKADEAAKSKAAEMEARQMAAGQAQRQIQAEDELAALIKKNREEWGNIVIEQLESVGSYTRAAEEQIKLNKLTDEYRTLLNTAGKSKEAAAALQAQDALDQQKLLAAKRSELDIATDHEKTMLNIESAKYAAKGLDADALYLKVGYKQALLEEQILQNQITTEINPLRKSQMQEQLDAQAEVNRLVKEEVEQRQKSGAAVKQQSKNLVDEYNRSITISRSQDEQYANDRYITSGQGRMELLKFYGTWTGYVENMALDRIAAYEREKAEAQLIEDQKLLVEAIQNAADRLSQASVQLASSGSDLAKSLRAAQVNLLGAKVDLAASGTSTLSPEQKYQLAMAAFTNTAASAQATGDVNLFNQLPELARQLLESSQGYNASGSAFAADYAMVQQILTESADSAGAYATTAEQMVTLLQQQADLLDAIKTALETGGDTASLLSSLNTVNNQVVATLGTVNTSVGATTTAANATATAVWSDKAVSDAINASVAANTNSTASWLSSVNSQTSNVATYTNATKTTLGNSLLASQSLGRIDKAIETYNVVGNPAYGTTTTFTYYAKGGIANDPSGRSIFGEAGPEAAVPLPDGRSIPVTIKGAADNRGVIDELKALRSDFSELKSAMRRAVAGR